jgi:hypothetical protein
VPAPAAAATSWELQVAKFKTRQAQLKAHEDSARRAARRAFKESRGVRLHRAAYSYATETLMVRRAGAGSSVDPIPVIHHRAVAAPPERAAEEIMDLLLAVQSKLRMGVPVASLVHAATGEELDFEQYINPAAAPVDALVSSAGASSARGARSRFAGVAATPRVFPPGAVYVALTAAEVTARRLQVADANRSFHESMDGSEDENDSRAGRGGAEAELAALPWMGLGSDSLEPEQAAAVRRLSRAAPHRCRLMIHVTRAGTRDPGPSIPVVLPASVGSLGELRDRVSDALRAHEVAYTPCVALYHQGAGGGGVAGPSEMIQSVAELADGQRLLFRCANDLAPGMENNARAARRQKRTVKKMAAPAKTKVDSFLVAVARRSDPGGAAVPMRLPGAKALVHLTFDDICRRVRIAVGLPGSTTVRGLFRLDGSRLGCPADIAHLPERRLLYSTKSAAPERGHGVEAGAKAMTAKTTRVSSVPPLRLSDSLAQLPGAVALSEATSAGGKRDEGGVSWGVRMPPASKVATAAGARAGVGARVGVTTRTGASDARPTSTEVGTVDNANMMWEGGAPPGCGRICAAATWIPSSPPSSAPTLENTACIPTIVPSSGGGDSSGGDSGVTHIEAGVPIVIPHIDGGDESSDGGSSDYGEINPSLDNDDVPIDPEQGDRTTAAAAAAHSPIGSPRKLIFETVSAAEGGVEQEARLMAEKDEDDRLKAEEKEAARLWQAYKDEQSAAASAAAVAETEARLRAEEDERIAVAAAVTEDEARARERQRAAAAEAAASLDDFPATSSVRTQV